MSSIQDEIALYLQTGESDMLHLAWPGDSVITRAQNGDMVLRQALIAEVTRRAPDPAIPEQLANLDVAAFARERIEPMIHGLFPAGERPVLLQLLSRSIVFLTPDNIAAALLATPFASTAWSLANLYLLSCQAEPLSGTAPEIVGLSEATTCFVSMGYFHLQHHLNDFVVHEAAHVLHNCKRETIGLPTTRGREWVLDIEFHKRELFAYACEAYSRLLVIGQDRAARRAIIAETDWRPPDDSIDLEDYVAAVCEAINACNGWKRILKRCEPPLRRRARGLSISA